MKLSDYRKDCGLVFDFHRGTTHDGPGMRTTVFMKGCPLHCAWCHNPESITPHPELQWTAGECIGCHTCVNTCQFGAVQAGEEGISIRRDWCQECYQCAEKCPSGALKIVGTYWDVDSLATEALKDTMFFEDFEGGITLSGGEPILQYRFVTELLKKIKEAGQNTALDTCGLGLREAYESVYPYVDTFLYDIKLMDKNEHIQYTGMSNQLILSNLIWLIQKANGDPDKKIWIRTPLIPGATASEENIDKIGKFLKGEVLKGIERWELCAFNNVCRDKYRKIHLEWEYQDTPLMTEDDANHFLQIARKYVGEKAVLSGLTARNV